MIPPQKLLRLREIKSHFKPLDDEENKDLDKDE